MVCNALRDEPDEYIWQNESVKVPEATWDSSPATAAAQLLLSEPVSGGTTTPVSGGTTPLASGGTAATAHESSSVQNEEYASM